MKIKAEFHNGVWLEWEGENLTFTRTPEDSSTYEIKRGSDVIGIAVQPMYITIVDEETEDAEAV